MRKLYALLLPVLALVAFASVTAAASAAPEWEVCKSKTGGKFETVACTTTGTTKSFEKVLAPEFEEAIHVKSKNVAGTVAVLKAAAGGIECKTVTDKGVLFNEENVVDKEITGMDFDVVKFTECKGTGGLATCTVRTPITLKVPTELELEGTKIFNKYYPVAAKVDLTGTGCPGESEVTGSTRGEIASGGGKIQKFSGKTLKFLGEEAEFTGETEQEGPAGAGIFVS